MSHLETFENASTDLERALAAIEVVKHKTSKRLAWIWARNAIEYAELAGVEYAGYLVGTQTRYPDCSELEETLRHL